MMTSKSIRCRNFRLCQTYLPEWWSQYKSQEICTSCDIFFGTWGTQTGKGVLEFVESVNCPICFETAEGVSYPNCSHFICIDCFKRSWYGKQPPAFPIPELYTKYTQNSTCVSWNSYPKIVKWKETIRELNESKYEEQTYLRKCPICRL